MMPVELDLTPMGVYRTNTVAMDVRRAHEKNGVKRCVLVTTGSLNPVHVQHVRQLELAASILTEKHGWTVLAAWLSPSDASWASGKPFGSLGNVDKITTCQIATAEHVLVRTSTWEISQGKINYPAVVNHIRSLVEKDGVEVFYVCGADHAAKCGLYHRTGSLSRRVVVVPRAGQRVPKDEDTHCIIARLGPTDKANADISSTQIRRAVREGTLQAVQHMLHPSVAQMLRPDMFQ